jgi:predicted RNA-binding Zn ribbon-like protein
MMSDLAELAARDEWVELLVQTRLALSTLCADDLEELARHAERISGARLKLRSRSPEDAHPSLPRSLSAEHSLLADLLLATRQNLAVLQRSGVNLPVRDGTSEVNRRWAR